MTIKKVLCFLLTVSMVGALAGCHTDTPQPTQPTVESYIPTEKLEGSDLYVQKVENLPEETSLQRKVKALLLSGDDINIGSGYRPTSKEK